MIKRETIRDDLEKMNLDLNATARLIKRYGDYVKHGRATLESFAEYDGLRIDTDAASSEEIAWALATNDEYEYDDYAK